MERRVKIDKGPRRPGVSPNIYIYIYIYISAGNVRGIDILKAKYSY
jgi:hypothetical protein